MEVLLLQDIKGIGKKNDLLVVGDGFALNHLLPRRAALVATPLVRRRYAELIRKRAEEREQEKEVQAGTAKVLTDKTVMIVRKATKTGKLYAAIAELTIVEALRDQIKVEVSEDSVSIGEPIKGVGVHQVQVKLAGQYFPVNVDVRAEAAEVKGKKA